MDEKDKFWQYLIPYNVSKHIMGLGRTMRPHSTRSLKRLNKDIETGSQPQHVYLLDRDRQKRYMLQAGYTIDDSNNYGLVKKAVGNRKLPIYRTPGLSYDDDGHMQVIGNITARNEHGWLGTSGVIEHGGSYPTAIYYNDKDHYFYQRGWDLNDYGQDENKQSNGAYRRYNDFRKKVANALDFVGNPMVISTGYRRTPFNINNITLSPNYITTLGDLWKNVETKDIDTLREGFNTWLKEHKNSSIINPYTTDGNDVDDSDDYYYSLDENGNKTYKYEEDGKTNHNRYMIVNTTKVPEVVAKRKHKSLGGIY